MAILFSLSMSVGAQNLDGQNVGNFIVLQTEDPNGGTATVQGANIGVNVKLVNPYTQNLQLVFSGTLKGEFNGVPANFYCIDLGTGLKTNEAYQADGSTIDKITYILNNYYPYQNLPYSGSLAERREAAAIQIAIWHFADGVDANSIEVGGNNAAMEEEVRDRALAIIADANANADGYTAPETIVITPGNQTLVTGNDANFEVAIFDINGDPLSDIEVTLSTDIGTLSTTTVTTDQNGTATFTLEGNGAENATITASANVQIPQGTKFVHVATPNGSQKLVLATPTQSSALAQATVEWYTPNGDCDLNGYWTFTQGGWGSPSNSGPGQVRDAGFDTAFPNGMVIGEGNTITLTSADAVKAFLPQGGDSKVALTQSYQDPTGKISVLAGQIAAVTLATYYSEAGVMGSNPEPIGNLVFSSGTFQGMTIYDFLDIANKALGGGSTGYDLSDINDAATSFNENFVEGLVDKGALTCELTCDASSIGDVIWHDQHPVNGIQDDGEPVFEGVIVELLNSNGQVAQTDVTDENGKYLFEGVGNGNYKVRIADANFEDGGVFDNTKDNVKWYIVEKEAGNDDQKDSNGDANYEASVTVDCHNDLTIDFGFYKTCVDLVKSGPASVVQGEEIIYTFTVTNCGDVPLLGGVEVFDVLLNPDARINHKTPVMPGDVWEFEHAYVDNSTECGENITNIASAVGHPVLPNGTELEDITSVSEWTTTIECVEPAELGDKVWYDDNQDGIQDAGEDGVENILVKLFTCDDVLVATDTTDENGNYLFPNLVPGSYKVEFQLPDGFVFTTQNAGNDSATDSDANANTGMTECTDLEAGESDLSWDAGIYEEILEANLSIEKSASDLNPADGGQVTYTIKVTNNGPNDASDVVVSDVLVDGLDYVSTSSNDYDVNTGIWTVGSLSNGESKELNITVTVNADECATSSFDFGPATGYNLFVLRDFSAPSSDVEGKVAVGRDVSLANYSIGDKLGEDYTGEDVLIVGRDLFFTSGRVYFGNAVYGRSTNLPRDNVSIDGELIKDNDKIDFAAAGNYLRGLSGTLAQYQATDTTRYEFGGVFLVGNDPFMNVFNVDGDKLTNSTYMEIHVPNGAVVLVNILGNNIDWSGGLHVYGTDKTNILYNFPQAREISIHRIDVLGAILAPRADIDFVDGLISGQVMAKSLKGKGQINNHMFGGNIPCPTEITNVAEITAVTPSDPDLSDNVASVDVTVTIERDPAGDPENENDDWTPVAGFGFNEIVWTMATDVNGHMYAGTWGGKIYKSTDDAGTWNIINDGMDVAFIWSIAIDDANGKIWVGTEKGAFISRDNGENWELRGLDGQDVRAIVVAGQDHVYAGSWGNGVFELSSATNYQFVDITDDNLNTAVHALAVNSFGDVYAGTFGGGVFKLMNGTEEWLDTDSPSKFIWTLGVTSDDDIFAGSYGNGVVATFDNGANWYEMNENLPGQHVYSIVVDNNDNVYITTWTGGVFMLTMSSDRVVKSGNSNSVQSVAWEDAGLTGFNVSTLLVNQVTGTVFAGTSTGAVLKKTNSVVSVSDEEVAPIKFELAQNYPNPFNPSTTIKFSIAKEGFFSVKVYSILGQEVTTLLANDLTQGNYEVSFDASKLASGIYIYQLVGDNVNFTKKMMLIK